MTCPISHTANKILETVLEIPKRKIFEETSNMVNCAAKKNI